MPRVSWLRSDQTLVIAAVAVIVALLAGLLLGDRVSRSDSSSSTTTTSATTTTAADPAVVDLQRLMTRLGYYNGAIDGVYGNATTNAVKAMQEALGVTADGVYGACHDRGAEGQGE